MGKKPTYQELEDEIKTLRLELKRNKNEEYYKAILENSTDAISIIDANGKSLYRSPSYENVMGYSVDEMFGSNMFKNVHREDKERLLKQLSDSKKNPGRAEPLFFRAYHKDGTLRYFEGTGRNMLDSPIFKGIVINYRDVTERTRVEQALKEREYQLYESNNAKDKLFSIIGHDLKNPLNSIIGFSELLSDSFDKFDVDHQKEFINIIKTSSHNAYSLLENLLLWSRSQQDAISCFPEKENLYLLSNETLNLIKQLIDSKKIRLKNNISKNIFVNVDRNMVLTIFRNILTNAVKFSHKESEVSILSSIVSDENNQPFVKVTIKDNGVGISKDIINKLFTVSEHISTKGTESESGTGLGLIICKEFVLKHNGKIWVESKVGEGSSFIFTLPVMS